eukprot:TRINITY_DN77_c0_g1_i2.p1 TRINITY_DN77_c0_g1~~TRINITY_DN77_c0_g1_i2.p1  ORF type:complete len:200 (+),score=24.81 TRINITY_DN77_c0_g1_i2:222-821(+)
MLAIQQLSKYPCNTSSGSYDCLTEYMEILEHILKETPLNIIRYQGLNANGSVNCALFRFGALSTIPKASSNVLREVFQKQGKSLSIRYLKNQCHFNHHVLTNPMVLRLILSEGYDWTDFVTWGIRGIIHGEMVLKQKQVFKGTFMNVACKLLSDSMARYYYCFDNEVLQDNSMQDVLVSFDITIKNCVEWFDLKTSDFY